MCEAGAAIFQGRSLLPRGTPASNLLVPIAEHKMGKWLQERGPGVYLGGLRGSLGRSFGDPGRSPVGFWIVLGGVRVSLLGAQGWLWILSLLSWGS